jgi:hypothetical protein
MAGAGRCFGLLHPALPADAPLTVLQVAWCGDEPARMAEILGPGGVLDAGAAVHSSGSSAGGSSGIGNGSDCDSGSGSGGSSGRSGNTSSAVACFYSIYSTQPGLSGLDLGRTTILRAAAALQAAAAAAGRPPPRIVTLSPMPGFRSWLEGRLRAAAAGGPASGGAGPPPLLLPGECRLLLQWGGALQGAQGRASEQQAAAAEALLKRIAEWPGTGRASSLHAKGLKAAAADDTAALRPLLLRLGAVYLVQARRAGAGGGARAALDPVANFHLSNGASVWRVNFGCGRQATGLGVRELCVRTCLPQLVKRASLQPLQRRVPRLGRACTSAQKRPKCQGRARRRQPLRPPNPFLSCVCRAASTHYLAPCAPAPAAITERIPPLKAPVRV